jgi:hypothetical protein
VSGHLSLRAVGAGFVPNPIPAQDVSDIEAAPTNAQARITFGTDGTITYTANSPPATGNWFSPTTGGIGALYWVRATLTAGANPTSGTMSTWLQLNSARFWQNQTTITQVLSSTVTFEIAIDSGGVTIIATVTGIDIYAERTV